MKIKILIAFVILLFPVTTNAFLGKNSTGGTSTISLGNTNVKVNGGFIEWYDDKEISIRGKAIDISINVDNSTSNEPISINFIVNNINPEITKVLGWDDDKMKKGKNSLTFPAEVEAKKVALYKLSPQLEKDEFMFMVFGESRGGINVFHRILGDINYRKPLFAISCGDMIESSSASDYKAFLKEINSVGVPFLTVAGESEVGSGNRRLYEDFLGNSSYSFDFKNSHFVIIDNGDKRMREGQFLWLENDLIENKSVNTFLFMHVPPHDPRPGNDPFMKTGKQHKRLSGIIEKYKITRVFTSGVHGYFKEKRGSVTYITTGGGGSELDSLDSYYNYVLVDVKGGKVKDKLIKLTFPPLGWFDAMKVSIKLYLKNSFASHPILASIALIIGLFILFIIISALNKKLFGRPKKRISL